MRSEDREAVGAGPTPRSAALGDRLGRLARRLGAPGPAAVRVAAIVGLAALAASASLALLGDGDPGTAWLQGGRSFADDEAASLRDALALEGITARLDDRNRVGVDPERFADAAKVADGLGLGRRSPREELEDQAGPGLLTDPSRRDELALRHRARVVEAFIERKVDGIRSATVLLFGKARAPFTAPEVNGATVNLDAGGDEITQATLDRVLNVVIGCVPELTRDRISVLDPQGDALLMAGDPSFERRTRAQARAIRWEAQISEKLRPVIAGVRVSVRAALEPTAEVEAEDDDEAPRGAAVRIGAVAPNAPLSLDDPPAEAEPDGGDAGRIAVMIEVPAAYYAGRYRAAFGGDARKPEDLEPFVGFTEEYVAGVVEHVVPGWRTRGELKLLMLPMPAPKPSMAGASPTADRWSRLWWAPAALVGGGAALALLAAAGGRLPSRRPAARSGYETLRGPHLPLRDDDAPGPADRVRELVRSDPAAAAAVLRRWVGQGGHA